MRIAPESIAALDIVAQHHILVRGFTIRNAYSAVRIAGDSHDNVIEENHLAGGFYTVAIRQGATRNHLRRNTITLDAVYGDVGRPEGRSIPDRNAYMALRKYNARQIHAAVYVQGKADNAIYDNEIYRHFAGVFPYGGTEDPDGNRRLKIYGNSIHHIAGYCLPLNGAGADSEIHDNLLYESHCTMRIEQNPFGPIYIYRNRFHHETQEVLEATPRGYLAVGDLMFSFFRETPETTVYLYHNSFSGAAHALTLGVKMPNVWFLNNIFSARNFLVSYREEGVGTDLGGAHFDYNWCGGAGARARPEMGGHNVFAPGVRLWEPQQPDFTLTKDSPARGIGIDLSKSFTVDGVTREPLPGMRPGYFKGDRPDAGAVQHGGQ